MQLFFLYQGKILRHSHPRVAEALAEAQAMTINFNLPTGKGRR